MQIQKARPSHSAATRLSGAHRFLSWCRQGSGAPHLGALIAYALLAILVTWPVARAFRSGVVGEVGGVDAYQNAWNLWWTAQALRSGHSPFWTPLLFYPDGVDLFWQTLGLAQGLVALPVTLALGPLAAENWTVLLSFVLGGYATFLFARHILQPATSASHHSLSRAARAQIDAAALLAGAVYAFSPFHLEKVLDGNLEVASIQWVPCYALALHVLLERPGLLRALLAGALLLWVSLGSWYYGMFCVLYTGCVVVLGALAGPLATIADRRSRLARALWGLAPLLIWGLALAPRIAGLAQAGDQTLQDMRSVQVERSADLLDFFLPSPVNPLWGPAVRAARATIYPNAVIWNVALGSLGLALGILGALTSWRNTWRWLALLAASMLLAMGPTLRVAGLQTGLPLPFVLIQDLPGIRAGQRPNHMAVVASLMLALLAAYGAAWLIRRFAPARSWLLAAMLATAVVAIDGYAGPLQIVRREVHPFYASLPQPDGALMPLPMYVNINRSENLTTQLVHGWPILGGYVARPPRYPFAQYTPAIRELQEGAAQPDDILTPGWPELGRQALAAYQIRYITLDLASQKDRYFAQVRPLLHTLQLGPPLLADQRLEAYAVPRSWPVQPLAFLGAGWQPLEHQPGTPFRWRWIGASAEIRLRNPFDQPVTAAVTLSATSYRQSRTLAFALDGANLGQIDIPPDQQATRQIGFVLPPGDHTLVLNAPADPDPARTGAAISVRVFALQSRFSPPIAGPVARP